MWWIIGLFVLWIIGSLGSGGGSSKSQLLEKKTSRPPRAPEKTRADRTDIEKLRASLEASRRSAKVIELPAKANEPNDLGVTKAPLTEMLRASLEASRRSAKVVELPAKANEPNDLGVTKAPLTSLERSKNKPVSREEEIEIFVKNRGIEYLVHFTQVGNIENILTHGLLGRASLESRAIDSRFNDQYRFDNVFNAISASISFPNYKMFYSIQQKNPSADWVVIKLKASILWEVECAFNVTNAASSSISAIPIDKRKEVKSLKAMFDDCPYPRTRANLNIPNNYATDPQGEVLLLGNVETRYIESIAFNERSKIKDLSKLLYLSRMHLGENKFVHDPSLFKPRMDYPFWMSTNQGGAAPNTFNDIHF